MIIVLPIVCGIHWAESGNVLLRLADDCNVYECSLSFVFRSRPACLASVDSSVSAIN